MMDNVDARKALVVVNVINAKLISGEIQMLNVTVKILFDLNLFQFIIIICHKEAQVAIRLLSQFLIPVCCCNFLYCFKYFVESYTVKDTGARKGR